MHPCENKVYFTPWVIRVILTKTLRNIYIYHGKNNSIFFLLFQLEGWSILNSSLSPLACEEVAVFFFFYGLPCLFQMNVEKTHKGIVIITHFSVLSNSHFKEIRAIQCPYLIPAALEEEVCPNFDCLLMPNHQATGSAGGLFPPLHIHVSWQSS